MNTATHTPTPCPFAYPMFMDARANAICAADDSFYSIAGRWADQPGERAGYIAAIESGIAPGRAGIDAARAALAKAGA